MNVQHFHHKHDLAVSSSHTSVQTKQTGTQRAGKCSLWVYVGPRLCSQSISCFYQVCVFQAIAPPSPVLTSFCFMHSSWPLEARELEIPSVAS